MSNYVSNALLLTGDAETIAEVADVIDSALSDGVLDFQALVPVPDHLLDQSETTSPTTPAAIDWRRAHWGTKSNGLGCEVALRSSTRLGLTFETAWMAPTGLYATLRARYGVRLDALAIYEGDTHSGGWDVIAEDIGLLPDLVTIKDVLDEGGNPIGTQLEFA